ncbi:MAG TPA: CBS domain-containing protein [Spongiibacteraceae bacterium]|nr:CBS domain-containing protein [Spongiibacteraceae bacterium]
MQVREIMHTDVKSCSPDCALDAVALTMWNNDCGAIPIVDKQGKPIGIVTDRDIAMGSAIQHKPLWNIKSIDIAQNRSLFMCALDEDIFKALELMQHNQVRRLPVVDNQGKLAGILSLGDVVANTGNSQGHRKAGIPETATLSTLKAVVSH